ncbi:pilus assembly protein TadG-related protein [Arthrobacter sp.]|uniref:pilus assembly protein TadG-related protein n=1 Tax=Arthrobacter sp. TaxID=1667 RepID=UPI00339705DA
MMVERPANTGVARGLVGASNQQGRSDEGGQVLVLLIGFVLLSLLILTVVMGASTVYVERKKLLSVADGAALAAADTFALADVEAGSGAPVPSLDGGSVRGSVLRYLSETDAYGRFDQLTVAGGTGSPERRTAHVELSAVVRPPVVNFLVPAGIPVTVSSDARSELRR